MTKKNLISINFIALLTLFVFELFILQDLVVPDIKHHEILKAAALLNINSWTFNAGSIMTLILFTINTYIFKQKIKIQRWLVLPIAIGVIQIILIISVSYWLVIQYK